MFNRKAELISYVEKIGNEYQSAEKASPVLLEEAGLKFSKNRDALLQALEEGELLVPVIGGFSAGKSTALNAIMGETGLLPVAVPAETAIPAELRFGEDEYIQAITVDGSRERHSSAALKELSANAACYEVVQIYLNKPILKSLQPFTLIDMPGFDSPLEQHNKAILRYISKGAHYLYMVNAQDGTLKRQDMKRLHEIADMGRSFSVFLTKKDLVAEADLQRVQSAISVQIRDDFGDEYTVKSIGLGDIESFQTALKDIDPDRLFNSIFINEVKSYYYAASADINSAIAALSKSKKEGVEQIEELKSVLENILVERDARLLSLQSGYARDASDRIMKRIESDLRGSIDEFSSLAKSPDALGRSVSDVIRSAMIDELGRSADRISNEVVRGVSGKLNVAVNADFRVTEDFMVTLASSLRGAAMDALLGVGGPDTGQGKGRDSGATLGGILASIAAFIPHPVVKIVMMILPGIVGKLFDNFSESREKTQFAEQIRNSLIPGVMSQVRPQVVDALMQLVESITREVSAQFESRINAQKDILEKRQVEFDARADDIERSVDVLISARKNVNSLTENYKIIA